MQAKGVCRQVAGHTKVCVQQAGRGAGGVCVKCVQQAGVQCGRQQAGKGKGKGRGKRRMEEEGKKGRCGVCSVGIPIRKFGSQINVIILCVCAV